MAKAHFYCMDYRVLSGEDLLPSVRLTFPSGFEADISDHAALEPPAAFSPLIWYTTFRNSEDYATFLASVGPEMPPSQSPVYAFCTRTFGGQSEFCNFNLPIGGAGLADFEDYLDYHFGSSYPAVVSAFEALSLSPSSTRLVVMNAISHILQPTAPTISWG